MKLVGTVLFALLSFELMLMGWEYYQYGPEVLSTAGYFIHGLIAVAAGFLGNVVVKWS